MRLERGQARVLTRNGHDWSDRYPSIVRAASSLGCHSAIIDGGALVQDGNGISDFEGLSSASGGVRTASSASLRSDVFDGPDIRQQPLSVRRSILKGVDRS